MGTQLEYLQHNNVIFIIKDAQGKLYGSDSINQHFKSILHCIILSQMYMREELIIFCTVKLFFRLHMTKFPV